MDADLPMTSGNADLLSAMRALEDLVAPSFFHPVPQPLKPLHNPKLICQVSLIFPKPAINISGKHAIIKQDQTGSLKYKPQFCTDKPVHHNKSNDQVQQKSIQFVTSVTADHKPPKLIS